MKTNKNKTILIWKQDNLKLEETNNSGKVKQQSISVIGRSLIRTFLASATKDATICMVSEEQAQNKKMWIDLVHSKRMITFAPDDES